MKMKIEWIPFVFLGVWVAVTGCSRETVDGLQGTTDDICLEDTCDLSSCDANDCDILAEGEDVVVKPELSDVTDTPDLWVDSSPEPVMDTATEDVESLEDIAPPPPSCACWFRPPAMLCICLEFNAQ